MEELDGRVERLTGTTTVPPSLDPSTGVDSRDAIIDPSTNVSASLYLPRSNSFAGKLPILLYFHGGGFCIESAASPKYHRHLNSLSSLTPLLAVSLNYRLAPEHRLPAAYHDAWAAIQWVLSQADPWVAQFGDLNRLFVAGDSAGGNIAHQLVMRAGAVEYYEKLKTSGWKGVAEFVETPAAVHVFHLSYPESEIAVKKIRVLADFFGRE
ncbi:hypothetical protein M5K25_006272 [Dendrobium thyrsiflorum]|uniref:Alpha/beta hydrolase fold-3 domain-containing protein n=1 Tax=Dendrobium thyrsiflorum TaxID=117978 RepID=A0ABD0VB69_DENTH